MSDITFDQVKQMIEQLPSDEVVRLREWLNLPTVDDAEEPPEEDFDWTDEELAELFKPGVPKTGVEIAAMIASGVFDNSDWSRMINPHITDSVEWVKALRRNAARKRNLNWGDE